MTDAAAPKRILVVDDDQAIRDFLVLALSDEGYDVRAVTNGQAALAALDTFPAQLVLLDIRMPVMDGLTFVSAYAQRPTPRARVVGIAASPAALAMAHTSGVDAVLAKPFDLTELLSLVALQLDLSLN